MGSASAYKARDRGYDHSKPLTRKIQSIREATEDSEGN